MKKFEEEINKKVGTFDVVGHHNGVCCLVEEVKALGKNWVSPEDHQTEIEKLKSQLEKQQPEIPEFVAEWIEYWKRSGRGVISIDRALTQGSNLDTFEKIHSWLDEYDEKYDEKGNEIIEDRNGVEPPNVTLFSRAWVNGYTVAKEKRFYLKNKLTGQRLIRLLEENGGGFLECVTSTDKERMQFTQSQIDSMETGSYEQIEVEE